MVITPSTVTTTAPETVTRTTAASAQVVVKVYGRGHAAVRALDGTFTAVVGPSGSGKSTVMHVLAGLDDVDGGVVRLGHTEFAATSTPLCS